MGSFLFMKNYKNVHFNRGGKFMAETATEKLCPKCGTKMEIRRSPGWGAEEKLICPKGCPQ
jgi:predicted RNA-binding Zn-ribbon protein involved in translation (DUF1610 family)